MKIELKNVTKVFDNVEIIKDVSVIFEGGNIYGLHGRNGSGKSVLMKLICGLYEPTKGEILYNDINLNAKGLYPESLRASIEKPSFYPDLTGFENLKELAKIQNKITDEDILKSLEIVNLTTEKEKKYSKYSLGMKQKLAIAQAIMEHPNILILDEPFNGIEDNSIEKIINYLKEEAASGKLIIFSTHIKDDLNSLATVIYHLDNGTLKLEGETNETGI